MGSFGTEISGNRRPRVELSSEMRAAILHGLEKQISPTQMAKEFVLVTISFTQLKNDSNSTIP